MMIDHQRTDQVVELLYCCITTTSINSVITAYPFLFLPITRIALCWVCVWQPLTFAPCERYVVGATSDYSTARLCGKRRDKPPATSPV